MRYALLVALTFCVTAPVVPAANPDLTPVEKQLAIQTAMANARKYLDANQPSDAVACLEKELSNADGNKTFLNMLREAYLAELFQLDKAATPDTDRIAKTRRKLALLAGDTKPVTSEPPATPVAPVVAPPAKVPEPDLGPSLIPLATPPAAPSVAPPSVAPPVPPATLAPTAKPDEAIAAFKKRDFAEADRLFTLLGANQLTAEQKNAWAYCRIKLNADRVNAANCTAATATTAIEDVTFALQLIAPKSELHQVGQQVITAAQAKGGTKPANVITANGNISETANFRVHHGGNRELGDAVAKAAEGSRKQIFERWSGPPGGAWQAKCDIVIHANADAYAKATAKPGAFTGHATTRLTNNRVTDRRIDLRADDDTLIANTLPRELTHVVLADLFADKPPPKWALEGMAILAGSPEEVSRYSRTLTRCARDGELRNLATLFDLKDFPTENITGFYCQSVSVTEYLISLKGERNFKIFLSDAQRYGTAQALKRQYNIDSVQTLESAWKRANADLARGK